MTGIVKEDYEHTKLWELFNLNIANSIYSVKNIANLTYFRNGTFCNFVFRESM